VLHDKLWIYDKIHHEIKQICSPSSLHMYMHKFATLDERLIESLHAPAINRLPMIEM
jgi:hypothetical protein